MAEELEQLLRELEGWHGCADYSCTGDKCGFTKAVREAVRISAKLAAEAERKECAQAARNINPCMRVRWDGRIEPDLLATIESIASAILSRK